MAAPFGLLLLLPPLSSFYNTNKKKKKKKKKEEEEEEFHHKHETWGVVGSRRSDSASENETPDMFVRSGPAKFRSVIIATVQLRASVCTESGLIRGI